MHVRAAGHLGQGFEPRINALCGQRAHDPGKGRNGVGASAVGGAVRHRASDDRRAPGSFGPSMRGLTPGLRHEAPHLAPVVMPTALGEPPLVGPILQAAVPQLIRELRRQRCGLDREVGPGGLARLVPQRQRLLQTGLELRSELPGPARLPLDHVADRAPDVGQTRWLVDVVDGLGIIAAPSSRDQDAGLIGRDDLLDGFVAMARADLIDGGRGGLACPQVSGLAADTPARVSGVPRRRLWDRRPPRRVPSAAGPRGASQGLLRDGALRQLDPAHGSQDCWDLTYRHPDSVRQGRRCRPHPRPQPGGRRPGVSRGHGRMLTPYRGATHRAPTHLAAVPGHLGTRAFGPLGAIHTIAPLLGQKAAPDGAGRQGAGDIHRPRSDGLRRRRFPITAGPRSRLPAWWRWRWPPGALGERRGLPLSTPLAWLHLGAQRLLAGPPRGDLAVPLRHQGQPGLSTQGLEGRALNHGLP